MNIESMTNTKKYKTIQLLTKIASFTILGMAIFIFIAAFMSAEAAVMPVITFMVVFGVILYFVHESALKLSTVEEDEQARKGRARSAWIWLFVALIPISMGAVLLPTAFKAIFIGPPTQQEMPSDIKTPKVD
ncbi:MAG: hypothetical protein GY810_20940 [Aureispira sp.]|nr:hypothetical protein [Aureispira sp.]